MITRFGMSKKFGLMGLATVESQYLDGRASLTCSDVTAADIDTEVMKALHESYKKAKKLLKENRAIMDKLAAYLIEKETITGKEFMKIYRREKGIPEPKEEEENTAGEEPKQSQEQAADAAMKPQEQQQTPMSGDMRAWQQAPIPGPGQGMPVDVQQPVGTQETPAGEPRPSEQQTPPVNRGLFSQAPDPQHPSDEK